MFRTIAWTDEGVVLLDQRLLPEQEIYLTLRTGEEVAAAIRDMAIRGAPAIGVAAAMGIALGFVRGGDAPAADRASRFDALCHLMAATRPTAVNLFWAIDRMRRRFEERRGDPFPTLAAALRDEALRIGHDDLEANHAMGRFGAALLPERCRVLTHCNAGALATSGYGTALGVLRAAVAAGKRVAVYADETRPFLQGARLTAWELQKDHIPVTVMSDGMAGHLFQKGEVDLCIVGADRIARNGDVANKIGTYPVAVLAEVHKVPFYVAAPFSTIDASLASGVEIPIEERDAGEVRRTGTHQTAPEDSPVYNPAFDVTPAALITAIITERGVFRPPYRFD